MKYRNTHVNGPRLTSNTQGAARVTAHVTARVTAHVAARVTAHVAAPVTAHVTARVSPCHSRACERCPRLCPAVPGPTSPLGSLRAAAARGQRRPAPRAPEAPGKRRRRFPKAGTFHPKREQNAARRLPSHPSRGIWRGCHEAQRAFARFCLAFSRRGEEILPRGEQL